MLICVCMNIWGVGGAEIGIERIAKAMPQHDWFFVSVVEPCDCIIYMNNSDFYHQAKALNIPKIILRTTGERSLKLMQFEDLYSVICSSKKAYEYSKHRNKQLIYNGIDLEYLKNIKPIDCEWLCASARIGVGQHIEEACELAIKKNKHLTILGGQQHLDENTYNVLKRKYKQFRWVGVVKPEEASRFIKGCKALLNTNPSHGVSNANIEALLQDKEIISLCKEIELPPKEELDLKVCVEKYERLINTD